MVEVIVFAEGQSEEQFIKRVVAPALHPLGVFLKPQTLRTSQDAGGGALNFDRLKFHARNTLRQRPKAILTTFLDLYGLDTGFPDYRKAAEESRLSARVACLERGLHAAVRDYVDCHPERFIPHIQPYELEGLLFSDVTALCEIEPEWRSSLNQLRRIREAFATPEEINDGYETKPSKRLEKLLRPGYRKTRHAPLAAERITLDVIEAECVHFHSWVEKLRGLSASGNI